MKCPSQVHVLKPLSLAGGTSWGGTGKNLRRWCYLEKVVTRNVPWKDIPSPPLFLSTWSASHSLTALS
jgi:hypothetical protein